MAKSHAFTVASARITAQRIALKQQREGGFNAGENALGGIYSSLGTTLRGVSGKTSADNARRVAALDRIQQRSAARAASTVAGAQSGITTRYGAALGQTASQQLAPAAAQAHEVAGIGKAATRAGAQTARGINQAMGIERTAATASRASADYAMASALDYRAKNDASLIAQQKTDLAKARLDAQLQWQNWKREQDYLQKQKDKANPALGSQLSAVAGSAASSFTGLHALYENWDPTATNPATGNPYGPVTPAAIAAAYIGANGITDPNEQTLVTAISRAMYPGTIAGGGQGGWGGHGSNVVWSAVQQQLTAMYPDFAKYSDQVQAAVIAQVKAAMAAQTANDLAPPGVPTGVGLGGANGAGAEGAQGPAHIPGY